MSKSFEIIKKRIALGGYRLAEIIKEIKISHDSYIKSLDDKKTKNEKEKFLNLID